MPAQFRGSPIAPTLHVSSVIGPDNNSSVMSGLRIYFGNSDKSLIRRHREDDPPAFDEAPAWWWAARASNSNCEPEYNAAGNPTGGCK